MSDNLQCKIRVKVVPGSSQNQIVGWIGEQLKIRVSAPPDKGRANAAVESIIAVALNIPQADVQIVKGKTSQLKQVGITGLSETEILRRLQGACL